MPLILGLLPNSSDGDDTLDTKIVSIKLPPRRKKKIFHHHHRHQKLIK
jgi:protein TonB